LATSECDIGLEEKEYLKKTASVLQYCVLLLWCTKVRAVLTGQSTVSALILLGLAIYFQAPLCLYGAIYIIIIIFVYILLFTFYWAEPGGIGPWPAWLTIVF